MLHSAETADILDGKRDRLDALMRFLLDRSPDTGPPHWTDRVSGSRRRTGAEKPTMDDPALADLLVEPSTPGRADVGAVLAGLTHTRPLDMRLAFAGAAAATEATDLPLSRFYRLLALAFEPTLRPDKVQEPFVPSTTFVNGERTLLPRDLAPGHLDLLRAALGEALHRPSTLA